MSTGLHWHETPISAEYHHEHDAGAEPHTHDGDRYGGLCSVPHPTPPPASCRVYWNTHGCKLLRGHGGHHVCDCCSCPNHVPLEDPTSDGCVGAFPYYGPETNFFGEDA